MHPRELNAGLDLACNCTAGTLEDASELFAIVSVERPELNLSEGFTIAHDFSDCVSAVANDRSGHAFWGYAQFKDLR
jgi:hypothetical protein